MHTVTGIFASWPAAARAVDSLRALHFSEDAINVLTPGSDPTAVPTDTGEQPGLGRAIGGVAGGAAGAAVGVQLLTAAASGLVPGVGPVLAVGAIAGLVAGIGGAATGQAIENSLTQGLPKDEVYLYEEALRQGRTVIVVEAPDAGRAEEARSALEALGAESLDAARETWWVGLREAEAREYAAHAGSTFARDEPEFRRGFEMALRVRGGSWEDAVTDCRQQDREISGSEAYRRGFERGRAYWGARARRN